MIALLQRVTAASVSVDGVVIAAIGTGLLALVGVQPADDESSARRLLVPQFTLAADTDHGLRPGFSTAAPPALARALFELLVAAARARHGRVETGRFGADMQVSLVNDGPVTFWLET